MFCVSYMLLNDLIFPFITSSARYKNIPPQKKRLKVNFGGERVETKWNIEKEFM